MRKVALLFFLSSSIFGCEKESAHDKRYIDMDSLINQQIKHLAKSNVSAKKEASIGGKISSTTSVLDSTTWSHELDVFRQLDLINRPIYKDAYQIRSNEKDSKSNLLIKSFEASATSAVPYLRMYYQDSPKRLRKLETLYQEINSLYASQRKLEMYFDDATGTPLVTSFSIEGNQKMILSDSVHYTIHTTVIQ